MSLDQMRLMARNRHLPENLARQIVTSAFGHADFKSSTPVRGRVYIPLPVQRKPAIGEQRIHMVNMVANLSLNPDVPADAQTALRWIAHMLGYESFREMDRLLRADVMDIHSSDGLILRRSEAYNGHPAYSRVLLGRFNATHTVLVTSDADKASRLIENEFTLTDLSGHRVVVLSAATQDLSYLLFLIVHVEFGLFRLDFKLQPQHEYKNLHQFLIHLNISSFLVCTNFPEYFLIPTVVVRSVRCVPESSINPKAL